MFENNRRRNEIPRYLLLAFFFIRVFTVEFKGFFLLLKYSYTNFQLLKYNNKCSFPGFRQVHDLKFIID